VKSIRSGFSLCGMVLVVQLVGCNSEHGDLEKYVADVQARPPGKIEPPPEFKPHLNFNYSAASMRSPFTAPMAETNNTERAGKSVIPDLVRTKEFLESFNFDNLRFVGSLQRSSETNTLWALINDGQGGVHRVKEGDHLGKNFGSIASISTTKVEVIEIVPSGALDDNGQTLWVERPRTMVLMDSL